MPLKYVVDEHLRGHLWKAIVRHNSFQPDIIDAICVGDPIDLPLGSDDPAILLWGERENRILVSRDWVTMPKHLETHIKAGHHCPGIFIIRKRARLRNVVSFLAYAAHESEAWEWQDRIEYIP